MHVRTCTYVRVYAHARLYASLQRNHTAKGRQLSRTGSLLELRGAVSLPMPLSQSTSISKQLFSLYEAAQ